MYLHCTILFTSLEQHLSRLILSAPIHCSPVPLQTLLAPAGSVYQKLAEECVKFGVGVELFLFPGTYCDVATLAKMAATTGGELHYYKNYQVCLYMCVGVSLPPL